MVALIEAGNETMIILLIANIKSVCQGHLSMIVNRTPTITNDTT
jgi:hypothetical protein